MKKIALALIIAAAAAAFTGCCLQHTWTEATCESPKTCSKCGKTEGEALGHKWAEATCETPKTCTVCGKTEGEALGHKWAEAACETPKTCTVCKKTEGAALGHKWAEATCTEPKTCTVCKKTEGKAKGHDFAFATLTTPKTCKVCGTTEGRPVSARTILLKEFITEKKYADYLDCGENKIAAIDASNSAKQVIDVYNMDGKKTASVEFPTTDDWSRGILENAITTSLRSGNKDTIIIWDWNGSKLYEKTIEWKNYGLKFSNNSFPYQENNDGSGVRLYNGESGQTIFCYDVEKKSEISEEEYNKGNPLPDYDKEKWITFNAVPAIDGYFVEEAKTEKWGYLDKNLNVIALYADATEFNKNGYALVSEDLKTYSIIDRDFNVVAKDYVKGKSAAATKSGSAFSVTDASDNAVMVIVE